MKTKLLLMALLLLTIAGSFAQDTWTQKADFGGIARRDATGFSIGNKGYIGCGYSDAVSDMNKDFWEYDPANNTWTQKADFGGGKRAEVVGFSIGDKGYMGVGEALNFVQHKDFWEYDPAANTWTRKADFGGHERAFAAGFSIGNKGYIGTGLSRTCPGCDTYYRDFWEYDQGTDTWTRKADFAGGSRSNPSSFSIGKKGYIGVGFGGGKDFWEYDPATDKWTRKADFGGSAREWAASFSIRDRGYIGTAYGSNARDFWEYDPVINAWTRKADFGGSGRGEAVGFSIGEKGYIGTGSGNGGNTKDFWEYTPDEEACQQPSNLQTGTVTSNDAKISWTKPSPLAPAFKIRYNIEGSPIVLKRLVKGTATAITLHDLQPNTTYEWKMRSACDEDKSDWITGPLFTTAGVATAAATVADNLAAATPGKLLVSPNPAKGQVLVQLQLPDKTAPAIFCLYNNQGTKVWQQYYGAIAGQVQQSISLPSAVTPGVYLLVVEWSGNRYTQKLVVQ